MDLVANLLIDNKYSEAYYNFPMSCKELVRTRYNYEIE
jgi:hypothetical protein